MRKPHVLIIIALLIGFATIHLNAQPDVDGAAISSLETSTPLFVNVSSGLGLSGVRGDSFVWGDWNMDGYQDILVKGSRLFRNMGPPGYEFKEVTASVGLENSGYSVWVDLDNDGYLDIFSAGHPYGYQDTVWINNGPPGYGYTNASHLSGPLGVDDGKPSIATGAGDIDHDGDLDIYVVNWRDDDNVKYVDTLWRNEGGGRFTDITDEAGIVDWNDNREEPNAGMGVNFGDYNDDGWIDIYVSNYLISPNYLWENQGDGTFVDVAQDRGCAGEPTRTPTDTFYGHTAGSQWADYDNDGDLDMWSSNLAHKDPYRTLICDDSQLWENSGHEGGHTFTNVRDQTGIPTVVLEQEELFFGIAWADYDNDGDLDMWIPQVKGYIDYAYSFLFRNNGDGTFTDVSEDADLRIWDSDGGTWCDYDNDGDLDLITEGKYPYENGTYEVHLFQNQGENDNHYLQVDLIGTGGNPSAVGARIWAFSSDGTLLGMREVEGGTAGHSYGPSLTQEFGLGQYDGTIELEIRWPTGNWQYVGSVGPDRRIEVREPRLVDLSIEVEAQDEVVEEGETIDVSVRLSNMGDSDIGGTQLYYHDSWDGGAGWEGFEELGLIPIGGHLDLEFSLSSRNMIGSHTLEFSIYATFPEDMEPQNNVVSLGIQVVGSNRPPRIDGVVLDTDTVEPGGNISIEVFATDPENGRLGYSFTCPYGSMDHMDPSSNRATWRAPEWYEVQAGLSTIITVTVSDEEGGSVYALEEVTVLPYDGPPSLTNVTISTSQIPNDSSTPVILTVKALDREGPIVYVTADLDSFGGGQYEALLDNGLKGDRIAGDGVFSIRFTVPGDVGPGRRTIVITAADDNGQTSRVDLEVSVVAAGSSPPSDLASGPQLGIMIPLLILIFLISVPILFLLVRSRGRRGGE